MFTNVIGMLNACNSFVNCSAVTAWNVGNYKHKNSPDVIFSNLDSDADVGVLTELKCGRDRRVLAYYLEAYGYASICPTKEDFEEFILVYYRADTWDLLGNEYMVSMQGRYVAIKLQHRYTKACFTLIGTHGRYIGTVRVNNTLKLQKEYLDTIKGKTIIFRYMFGR